MISVAYIITDSIVDHPILINYFKVFIENKQIMNQSQNPDPVRYTDILKLNLICDVHNKYTLRRSMCFYEAWNSLPIIFLFYKSSFLTKSTLPNYTIILYNFFTNKYSINIYIVFYVE